MGQDTHGCFSRKARERSFATVWSGEFAFTHIGDVIPWGNVNRSSRVPTPTEGCENVRCFLKSAVSVAYCTETKNRLTVVRKVFAYFGEPFC